MPIRLKSSFLKRWHELVSFLDTFLGRPNTDLVRRNCATMVCGLLWLIMIIHYFPYPKPEMQPFSESFPTVEPRGWFSPLSESPANIVERGLNFSGEFDEVLQIWGDRSELGEDLTMGERVVDELLSGLAELAPDQQLRVDPYDILTEYQQISSQTSDEISEYLTSLQNLATKINQTSTKAEQDLTEMFNYFQTPNRIRIFSLSVATKLQRIFGRVSAGLSPLLEDLVSRAEDLNETLLDMEGILNFLADPETHLLEQSHDETILGSSLPNYGVRRQFSLAERLANISRVKNKNVKAWTDVLAGYYSEVVALRGDVDEMGLKLMHMRMRQHVFRKWLARDELVIGRSEVLDTIQGFVALLQANRAGSERGLVK
ncbi:hypothetical protein IFR05_013323 [Cadophora sp. M221]|nr:hypothetical protein IFR05_013323 [Cadophora sp. M221]